MTSIKQGTPSNKSTSRYSQIAHRMKQYEACHESILDDRKPYMIRLDGHAFSKWTRPFRNPIDPILQDVMVCTAADMLHEFGASHVYTQSDEITLVFPALNPPCPPDLQKCQSSSPSFAPDTQHMAPITLDSIQLHFNSSKLFLEQQAQQLGVPIFHVTNPSDVPRRTLQCDMVEKKSPPTYAKRILPFAGRICKMASLASAYCTARFNYHCLRMSKTLDKATIPKYEAVMKQLTSGRAHFDARVFNVDSNTDILDNIMWRSNYDCKRNAIMALARCHFSNKRLHGLSSHEVAQLLVKEKHVSITDQSLSFRYGVHIKNCEVVNNASIVLDKVEDTRQEVVDPSKKNTPVQGNAGDNVIRITTPIKKRKIQAWAFEIPDFAKFEGNQYRLAYTALFLAKYWNQVEYKLYKTHGQEYELSAQD